jgi:hypothetical protein
VSIRFLSDADLNEFIVNGVFRREASIDFLTAESAGIRHLPDPEVLAFAVNGQRLLVSHDVNTMPHYFAEFIAAGNHSPGLLLIPQSVTVRSAIEELLLVWAASEASEWENRLVWLPL